MDRESQEALDALYGFIVWGASIGASVFAIYLIVKVLHYFWRIT